MGLRRIGITPTLPSLFFITIILISTLGCERKGEDSKITNFFCSAKLNVSINIFVPKFL